jgi:hypothetical protein
MALPTNDDFANCALSIDELDAVAGGGLISWIKKEVNAGIHWLESPSGKNAVANGAGQVLNWALHLL